MKKRSLVAGRWFSRVPLLERCWSLVAGEKTEDRESFIQNPKSKIDMMQAFNITRNRWLATELKPADTFFKRLIGLMGEAGLKPTEGLWIKPCDSIHTLGMRFAIDVIFLDRQGRVAKVVEELRPGRLVFPVATAVSVLELPTGTIARTGTKVGDIILVAGRWSLVAGEKAVTSDEHREPHGTRESDERLVREVNDE